MTCKCLIFPINEYREKAKSSEWKFGSGIVSKKLQPAPDCTAGARLQLVGVAP